MNAPISLSTGMPACATPTTPLAMEMSSHTQMNGRAPSTVLPPRLIRPATRTNAASTKWPSTISIRMCTSVCLSVCRSIRLGARRLHDRRPFGNFRLDVGAELRGRVADDVDAEVGQGLAHLGVVHGGDRGAMERGDHFRGRPGRRDDAVPRGGLEAGKAGFGNGRYLGQGGGALERRDRERADGAALEMRQER